MHILKLNWQGEVEWEQTFGWIGNETAAYIIPSMEHNEPIYYMFGAYDIDISENDLMMAKLDSSGEIIWERTYYPTLKRCVGFQTFPVLQNKKIVINAAQYNNYARPDNLLIEFDATNGDINWTKPLSFSPTDDVYFKDLEPTKDGGYVLGGYQYAATPQKSWIVKIDSLGNTCQQYDCDSTVLLDTSVGDLDFILERKSIKVSPNPATSSTQINFTKAAKKLRIYTATGILISEYELTESDRQKTLDIENFAKGIYLVELLYRDNNTQVEKLAVMD